MNEYGMVDRISDLPWFQEVLIAATARLEATPEWAQTQWYKEYKESQNDNSTALV